MLEKYFKNQGLLVVVLPLMAYLIGYLLIDMFGLVNKDSLFIQGDLVYVSRFFAGISSLTVLAMVYFSLTLNANKKQI